MTTAILLATRESELAPEAALSRLLRQLQAGGVDRVVFLGRPARVTELREAGVGDPAAGGRSPESIAGLAGQPVWLAGVRVETYESADPGQDLAALAAVLSATAAVVLDADLVASDPVITSLLAAGSGVTTWIYPLPDGDGAVVRTDRGRVISAGSVFHLVADPTARSAGLIRVGPAQHAAAAAVLTRAAALVAEDPTGDSIGRVGARLGHAVDLALVALVRSGVPVTASAIQPLVCRVVTDPAGLGAATAAIAAVDEDDARMRSAVKSDDDLFATYAVSSWSPYLVRWSARLGLSPTMVTWFSVILAVVAAAGFAQGGRVAAIGAGVLLYLSFVLDCVDGQLARYTRRYSRFGGWLDTLADRGKEYAAYAGLAIGAARTDVGEVWPLAIAVLTLQTVRHMTDCWYGVARDEAVARLAPAPFDQAGDGRTGARTDAEPAGEAAAPGLGRMMGALVTATNSGRRSVLHWVKKLMVFPIGERWMVLAVGGALFDARVVFMAMLVWGGAAAVYVFAVRILRTRSLRAPAVSTKDVALHRDDGALAHLLGRFGRGAAVPLPAAGLFSFAALAVVLLTAVDPPGPDETYGGRTVVVWVAVIAGVLAALAGRERHDEALDWLVPAALRAGELLLIIGVATYFSVPLPLLYGVVWTVALVHYDLAARLDKVASPFDWRRLALGWDGRLLVLALAAVVGQATLGFAVLTGYLGAVLVVGAAVGAVRSGTSRPAAVPVTPPRQRGEAPVAVSR